MTWLEKLIEEGHDDPLATASKRCPAEFFKNADYPKDKSKCWLFYGQKHDHRLCCRCWLQEAEEDKKENENGDD